MQTAGSSGIWAGAAGAASLTGQALALALAEAALTPADEAVIYQVSPPRSERLLFFHVRNANLISTTRV